MKKILTVLALSIFYTSLVQANPRVGDSSTLMGTLTLNNGQTLPITQTSTIVAMDVTTLTAHTVINVNGSESSEDVSIDLSDYPTEESMQTYLNNCSQIGGESRSIVVQGNTIPTCRIPYENGFTSLAIVPFYAAGFENVNVGNDTRLPTGSALISATLVAYTRGMQ